MRTIRAGDISPREAQERLRRMLASRRNRVEGLCKRYGAIIEAKSATITPVDTGFLRRANEYKVETWYDTTFLTIENRMIYARYQHDYPHHHTQPNARDHFIEIPFSAEIPALIDDIADSDMEALQ